ncbi:hypothetical protein [Streptomyces sp. NPDC085665]
MPTHPATSVIHGSGWDDDDSGYGHNHDGYDNDDDWGRGYDDGC